jgi:uncharacterized protein (DUF1501 family)
MEPRTLVVLYLRGAMDGLSAVPPVLDDDYHRRRPGLGVAAPKPGDTSGPAMLDERFALSADLAALLPAYREGRLAVVHAIGSDDDTLSHFEAQDQMEHGASVKRPLAGGWIGRWLRAAGEKDPLAAIAFGAALPESLRGAPSACAVESLDEIAVTTQTGDAAGFAAALAQLHAQGDARPTTALVCGAAQDSLRLLARVAEIREEAHTGARYPRTDLGHALSQVALLVKRDVGLRAAAVDHGGFDTHFGQGIALPSRFVELAEALAAFDADLGEARGRVTTVTLTEFGRRVYENASLGTDHGRASCAFVLGGGVRGGRVAGRWPGLSDADLEPVGEGGPPGDLRVTTDYRDLLWEILSRRFGASGPESVFPGLVPAGVGVMG